MPIVTVPFKGIKYKSEHTEALTYPLNSLVRHPTTGVKYLAYAYDVPANIPITDTTYWSFYDDGDVQLSTQVNTNTSNIANMINSGSNANGSWVKFSDGTAIASVSMVVSMSTNAFQGFTLPIYFVGDIDTSISMSPTPLSGLSTYWWDNINKFTSTNHPKVIYRGPILQVTGTAYITINGRWM